MVFSAPASPDHGRYGRRSGAGGHSRGLEKTETAAETEYKQPLAEGGAADAKIRGFLRDKALPQLALESNRTTIEKTRRRMRDFLLGGIEDAKAFDDVSRVVLDFMATVARDGDADPVVRVNAMLLVGELRAKDNKQPWAPASFPSSCHLEVWISTLASHSGC